MNGCMMCILHSECFVLLQNGQTVENGVTNALSTLVHPAQIHLPISQVRQFCVPRINIASIPACYGPTAGQESLLIIKGTSIHHHAC